MPLSYLKKYKNSLILLGFVKRMCIAKFFFKRLLRDKSGVSAVFGVLLILGLLSLFLSAFWITALPARIMLEESEEAQLLYFSVLRFSEGLNHSLSRHSSDSTGAALFSSNLTLLVSSEECLKWRADVSLPPASREFLRTEDDFYVLGRGSVIFSARYRQIPDHIYFLGPFGLVLSQEDGALFKEAPPIRLIRGKDNRILMKLSGRIIESDSLPLFGNAAAIRCDEIHSVAVHDFVSEIEILPIFSSSDIDYYSPFDEHKEKAVEEWFSDFSRTVAEYFPEMTVTLNPETGGFIFASSVPFEIDIQTSVVRIEFE